MIAIEKQEKLAALENNAAFHQAIANALSPDEVQKILAQFGAELSAQEVSELIQTPEGELSDTELDAVAGGYIGRVRRYKTKWIRIPPRMIPIPIMVPVF